ncbi:MULTISPECIES: hypothetical protein [unclassified Acinetobacter]|uniref:hypothetical protein n=1 Tax=unclassified Acinetobacter TaxID=196816 RepID=UPI0035BB64CA
MTKQNMRFMVLIFSKKYKTSPPHLQEVSMASHYKKQQRMILIAYIMMLLTALIIVPSIVAYVLANNVLKQQGLETWLNAHALWIKRNIMIFVVMAVFAGLWFIPLFFVVWNANLVVTATTIIGGVFVAIAWLFLLNSFLKGIGAYFRRKAVY